jgi:hypothetical protein
MGVTILMEPVAECLALLKRQAEIESALRQPGGIRVIEERELYALRQRLRHYPEAVAAILQTASNLHRPVDALCVEDIRRSA